MPKPYPVPKIVEVPVVVPDSAMVQVLRTYIARREAHPVVFNVRTGRFTVMPDSAKARAELIASEMAWYETWVRDVVEWMRSRLE